MLANIIDNRVNKHAWVKAYGVIEPTAHDNRTGGDQAPLDASFTVADKQGSIAELIAWANEQNGHVTLYLYDENVGYIYSKDGRVRVRMEENKVVESYPCPACDSAGRCTYTCQHI